MASMTSVSPILLAARDAILAAREASDEEDRRFAAWIRGEVHTNSVRAAERKHDKLSYDAIQAVGTAARLYPAVNEAWGSDALADSVLDAVNALIEQEGAQQS